MKACSTALLAVGCYGALVCLFMSGVLVAVFSAWSEWAMFKPWDFAKQMEWGRGVITAAVAGWPWMLGFVLCLGCAFAGSHLMMRVNPEGLGKQ